MEKDRRCDGTKIRANPDDARYDLYAQDGKPYPVEVMKDQAYS